MEKICRPWIKIQERQQTSGGYFFLAAEDLAATAALFFWLALLVLASFWPDFFWFAFGDLSPITFILVLRLTRLRHEIFSEGNPIVLVALMIVNGGSEFIWRNVRRELRRDRKFSRANRRVRRVLLANLRRQRSKFPRAKCHAEFARATSRP